MHTLKPFWKLNTAIVGESTKLRMSMSYSLHLLGVLYVQYTLFNAFKLWMQLSQCRQTLSNYGQWKILWCTFQVLISRRINAKSKLNQRQINAKSTPIENIHIKEWITGELPEAILCSLIIFLQPDKQPKIMENKCEVRCPGQYKILIWMSDKTTPQYFQDFHQIGK